MSALAAAKPYFEAWNRRSADGIVAAIEPGGTYEDPMSGGPLSGAEIARYAASLFEAFPDLSFEIVSESDTGAGAVAAQWVMRGTNTGAMRGAPPTGKSIELAGADFICTNGNLVTSVKGYFDSAVVPRQLGMQVIVQPDTVGPVRFGTSAYLQLGKQTPPGAFTITSLRVHSEAEVEKVRAYGERILRELPGMKGFISAVTGRAGSHMFTVTAWETAEDPKQIHTGAHREAVKSFFGPDLASSGVTSVWTPHRINTLWVRCAECGAMSATRGKGSTCHAGHILPAPPPHW
jgi:steroid delta-isomerase-like uncharacterized protein